MNASPAEEPRIETISGAIGRVLKPRAADGEVARPLTAPAVISSAPRGLEPDQTFFVTPIESNHMVHQQRPDNLVPSPAEPTRVLVIGAGGGMGRALVRTLASAGFDVAGAGRDAGRLDACDGLTSRHVCDARDLDAVDALVGTLASDDHAPPLRAIVNLAGCITLKPAHLLTAADWHETIAAKLTTAFACVRAAGKHLKSGGSVVLVSTVAAGVGLPNHEAIAAAGAGVEGLARSAAATYAARGLRVNVVAPALVDTPMASRITGSERALEHSRKMHPLGRIGTPDDVAPILAWLASDASSWVTGQVFGIDGGLGALRTG